MGEALGVAIAAAECVSASALRATAAPALPWPFSLVGAVRSSSSTDEAGSHSPPALMAPRRPSSHLPPLTNTITAQFVHILRTHTTRMCGLRAFPGARLSSQVRLNRTWPTCTRSKPFRPQPAPAREMIAARAPSQVVIMSQPAGPHAAGFRTRKPAALTKAPTTAQVQDSCTCPRPARAAPQVRLNRT